MSIFFSCSSVRGIGTFLCCANWISCSSSCSVNSGLTILRFASLCLASGVKMLLSSACFCCSTCCSACMLRCSSPICFCKAESLLLRSSSSSSSDNSFTFQVLLEFRKLLHHFSADFFSQFLQKFRSSRRHSSAARFHRFNVACNFKLL